MIVYEMQTAFDFEEIINDLGVPIYSMDYGLIWAVGSFFLNRKQKRLPNIRIAIKVLSMKFGWNSSSGRSSEA